MVTCGVWDQHGSAAKTLLDLDLASAVRWMSKRDASPPLDATFCD